MNVLLRSASLLALALAALTASAQNLVTNPGFETGNFTGYTVTLAGGGTNPSIDSNLIVTSESPRTGTYDARFGASSNVPDTISQSIATTPGQLYQVSYYLRENTAPAGQNAATQRFSGSFGASSLTTVIVPTTYTLQSFTATATSSMTTLSLAGYARTGFYYLDDVSVTAVNPTPEPATMAALGFGAVAMLRRRKRA